MDNEIFNRLDEQKLQLEKIYHSVEKTRKYFLWTLIVTVLMIVLPLIGIAFVIPIFLNSLSALPNY